MAIAFFPATQLRLREAAIQILGKSKEPMKGYELQNEKSKLNLQIHDIAHTQILPALKDSVGPTRLLSGEQFIDRLKVHIVRA